VRVRASFLQNTLWRHVQAGNTLDFEHLHLAESLRSTGNVPRGILKTESRSKCWGIAQQPLVPQEIKMHELDSRAIPESLGDDGMIIEVYISVLLWAILEMAFLPLPAEILIVPLAASQQVSPVAVAVIGAIGSTIGGLIDYAIGRTVFDRLDRRLHIASRVDALQKRFPRMAKYGLLGLIAFLRVFPLGTTKMLVLYAGAGRHDLRALCVVIAGSSFIRYFDAAAVGSVIAYVTQFLRL